MPQPDERSIRWQGCADQIQTMTIGDDQKADHRETRFGPIVGNPTDKTGLVSPRGIVRLALCLVLLIAIVGLWAFTPLDQFADLATALDAARDWAITWWAPLALLFAYLVAGLVVFPFTIMIAVTGLLYGLFWGFLLAIAGGVFAASVMFFLGRFLGQSALRRYGGSTVNRLSMHLGRHGITTIAILRLTPVASFGAINLVAGASHIRFVDYLIGTLVGMVPYAFAITLFGDQVEEVLHNPSIEGILVLLAVLCGILILALALDRGFREYRRRREIDNSTTEEIGTTGSF